MTTLATTPESAPSPLTGQTIVADGLRGSNTGLLIAWSGAGSSTCAALRTAVIEAGLPEDAAPKSRSLKSVLGTALRNVIPSKGFKQTKRPTPRPDKDTGARAHCSLYHITRLNSHNVGIGESTGNLALAVELHDDDRDLHILTDGSEEMIEMGNSLRATYNHIRDNEMLTAGNFTVWLQGCLVYHLGGTRVGASGWFVPSSKKELANRLVDGLKAVTGSGWVVADITTSAGLMDSIMMSFVKEVEDLESTLSAEYQKALSDGADDISIKRAAKYASSITEISDRALIYAALCPTGDGLESARSKLRDMKIRLEKVLTDTTLRFSLLELDDSPDDEHEDHGMTRAARFADEALANRLADKDKENRLALIRERADQDWTKDPDGLPPGAESWITEVKNQRPIEMD